MRCPHSIEGFRGPNGAFVMSRSQSPTGVRMSISCGRCIACRASRLQEWSTRVWMEVLTSSCSSFVTFTFDEEHYPASGCSDDVLPVLSGFWKRTRRDLEYHSRKAGLVPPKVRYLQCAEYGDLNWRVHAHALVCGHDFDRASWEPIDRSASGEVVYASERLSKLWPFGRATVQEATLGRCKYVCRYVRKKIGGQQADSHYTRVHPYTGEIVRLSPERATMSSKPGIGSAFFDRWEGDCYPSDFVVLDGQKLPVPKYFDRKMKARNVRDVALHEESDLTPIAAKRRAHSREPSQVWNNSPERLLVREEILSRKLSKLEGEL